MPSSNVTKQHQQRLLFAVSMHVAATIALARLFPKVGSIAGICGLVAVVFSAFCFGLRGGLLASLGQLLLNTTVMQFVIVPAVPIDGSSAVGVLFFFIAGAVIGNQRDLSRRLREQLTANERLRVREQEILSAIPDAMIRIDSQGKCHVQPKSEPLALEAAMEHVIGRPVPADKLLAVSEAISRVRATGASQLLNLELFGPTFYDMRCLPAADASLLLVIRDMTELRRLLRRVTSAENLASLGTLAAGLAHEVNNPLTYVITSVSAVAQSLDGKNTNLQAELDTALEGCLRIRDLVRDILETATGRQNELKAVFVPESVESAVALVNLQTRHSATIKVQTEDVLYAQAQRTKLMQVVMNLVGNASQAFEDHRVSANEIVVRAFSQGDSVVIEVEDNGCGMDEVTRVRALEPFFTTKAVGRGSGLGLFLCSSIVDSLGGTLHIDSEAGRGTKVTVKLHAAEEPPPSSGILDRPVAPTPSNDTGPLRVLVIDDEPQIRHALRRLLGGKHRVAFSANGVEALQRIVHGERYDVIICDLLMPEMTGIELFSQLQQRYPDQSERVVFLTGGATSESARLFIEGNRSRVLHKPFGPVEIESTLRTFAKVS